MDDSARGLGRAVSTLACSGLGERLADVDQPQRFAAEGVAFDYPGNWSGVLEHRRG